MRRILATCLLAALIGTAGPAHACSAFVVSAGGRVLAGNNEDFWNPETRVWFVPAGEGTHGRVYFGFANLYPQGGMNEKGLFFDGFATRPLEVTGSGGREKFAGNLIDEAMARCATVEEVVELFGRYDLEWLERAMLMFGDRTGDSVIIEGDVFLRTKGRHQVVTNFYQSLADPQHPPCERYRIADRMLADAGEIDLELARRVLAAVHAEGKAPTQYSNIYDLARGVVYLYHFHNFENVVVIDLAEELKKGARVLKLPELFPETFAYRRFVASRNDEIERRKRELRARDFDAATLDDYVGRYRLVVDGATEAPLVEVVRHEGALRAEIEGRSPIEMLPEGPDLFFHVDLEGLTRIRFVRGDDGEVVRAVLTPELGRPYEAERVTPR
jgi:hypothetical protein